MLQFAAVRSEMDFEKPSTASSAGDGDDVGEPIERPMGMASRVPFDHGAGRRLSRYFLEHVLFRPGSCA